MLYLSFIMFHSRSRDLNFAKWQIIWWKSELPSRNKKLHIRRVGKTLGVILAKLLKMDPTRFEEGLSDEDVEMAAATTSTENSRRRFRCQTAEDVLDYWNKKYDEVNRILDELFVTLTNQDWKCLSVICQICPLQPKSLHVTLTTPHLYCPG